MLNKIKSYARQIKVFRRNYHLWRFILQSGYLPNYRLPKTFNEKVVYRKRNAKHELFSICADKIAAKDYVKKLIGDEHIIENLLVGETVHLEQLQEILAVHQVCFLKANHNSGPVQRLSSTMSTEEIAKALSSVEKQLDVDYGATKDEPWYSSIERRLLVERALPCSDGESLLDYKFHVFKQLDGTFKIVLQVNFDTDGVQNNSFFDEKLNHLTISMRFPSIVTVLEKPKNYDQMLNIVKVLAEPFSYVRVDLYNIDGEIYFGEMTFANESGGAAFPSKAYDLWMGNLWEGDPSY